MIVCFPRVRALRKEFNLTQAALADQLGISRSTYLRYEQGCRRIPVHILIQLAQIFSVPTDYILELTNERHQRN